MKGSRSRMYKYFLLAITVGGFVFSGSWNNTATSDETSDPVKNQYFWEEGSDDFKVEAGRRRGKGNRGRRRGGNGLR